MAASMNADKSNLIRIDLLQGFALADRDQPVFGSMNDICMAVYMADPPVGTKMITQNKTNGQKGKKPLYCLHKVIIR